jgi:hypothetical protein
VTGCAKAQVNARALFHFLPINLNAMRGYHLKLMSPQKNPETVWPDPKTRIGQRAIDVKGIREFR